jgi:hypothetical protein
MGMLFSISIRNFDRYRSVRLHQSRISLLMRSYAAKALVYRQQYYPAPMYVLLLLPNLIIIFHINLKLIKILFLILFILTGLVFERYFTLIAILSYTVS